MNKYLIILLVLAVFVSLAAIEVFGIKDLRNYLEISSCGVLDQKGGYYILTKNLSSSAACLLVSADDITIDGLSKYRISHDTFYGIWIKDAKNINITGIITDDFEGLSDTIGFYVQNSSDVSISNTDISVNTHFSKGIKIENSKRTRISNYEIKIKEPTQKDIEDDNTAETSYEKNLSDKK